MHEASKKLNVKFTIFTTNMRLYITSRRCSP
jgi:hypothetical protein